VILRHIAYGSIVLALVPLSPGSSQSRDSSTTDRPQTFSVRIRRDAVPYRGVIAAPVDRVWRALPEAFKDLGYPGGPSTNPDEHLYLTRSLTIRGRLYEGEANSDYLDCGRTPAGQLAADFYEVQFAVLAWLAPQDGVTAIEVVIDGTARDRAQSSNSVFCTGKGRIEAALIEQLKARVFRR
jgi:hypothetical protein